MMIDKISLELKVPIIGNLNREGMINLMFDNLQSLVRNNFLILS